MEMTTPKATPRRHYDTEAGTEPSVEARHQARTVAHREGEDLVQMMTEIEDGLFVSWSRCKACARHARDCNCASGPTEPDYAKGWREKRFERSFARIPRHLQAKANDDKALSYVEIVTVLLGKLDISRTPEEVEALAIDIEHADRRVLRANLGLPADPPTRKAATADAAPDPTVQSAYDAATKAVQTAVQNKEPQP